MGIQSPGLGAGTPRNLPPLTTTQGPSVWGLGGASSSHCPSARAWPVPETWS